MSQKTVMTYRNEPLISASKSAIKLVVADLDGTLLDEDHRLTEVTKQAVTEIAARGVKVILATGRHYQDVYLLAEQLGVEVSLITSNGARVHNHQGDCLYKNYMPINLIERVLLISQGFAVHRNIYQEDVWFVEEAHEALLAIHEASGFRYEFSDFGKMKLDKIDKIYFTAEHELLLELENTLKAELGQQLNITFTSPKYLEVMNFGVNKGQALQRLMNIHNINKSEVMAFGDGMNDVEMLQMVKYGFVMDNASKTVKQTLSRLPVVAANSQNGVAKVILKLLL